MDYEYSALAFVPGKGITSDWSVIDRIIRSKDNRLTHLSLLFDWRSFSWKWEYNSLLGDRLFMVSRNEKQENIIFYSYDYGVTWNKIEKVIE